MVVLVDSVGAMVAAERVFQAPGVIRYLVDDPFFKEGFQGPVHGHPVEQGGHLLFYIGIGQGVGIAEEQAEYLGPAGSRPQV